MKVAPEPVMSEVVRQRLELLLAEVQPRYALPEAEAPPAMPPPRGSAAVPGLPRDRATGAEGGVHEDRSAPPSPRRAPPAGERVAQAGRRLLEFSREHLSAVVVVLLVGVAWTAYTLLQARSTPIAVAAPPSIASSPSATASAAPKILVHVIGAVQRPGVVDLAEGSRVQDAIDAAGGLAPGGDAGELNLAAVVEDGSQVVIGTRVKPRGEVRDAGGGGGGAGQASGSGKVSLNTATLEQLDTLPGVGPVTAQKILDWREQHGRFKAVSELQEVAGIGPKTYADIEPNVRV
nr:helix-hairpin-helix domain-containing protein [Propionicimonas sp.]